MTFSDEQAALAWWEAEHDNLIAAVTQSSRWSLHVYVYQLALPLHHWFFYRAPRTVDGLEAIYEIALEAARTAGDRHAEAYVLAILGLIAYNSNEFDRSNYYDELAVVAFRDAGDHYELAYNMISLGYSYVRLQQYENALRHVREGIALLETDIGEAESRAYGQQTLGLVYTGLRRFDEAFTCFQEALRLYRSIQAERGIGIVLHFIADAYRAAGRLDDAIAAYRAAAEHRGEIGHRQGEAESLRGLGEVLHESGDPDSARVVWRQAVAIYEELADPAAETLRTRLEDEP